MPDHLPIGMADALRLTRAGRLGEATAAIQRALAVLPSHAPPPDEPTPDSTVEGSDWQEPEYGDGALPIPLCCRTHACNGPRDRG
jgi:hypothetical protein